MDPDEALRLLREALEWMEQFQAGLFPRPDLDRAMTQAVDSFGALDDWIKSEGFLPADWRPATLDPVAGQN